MTPPLDLRGVAVFIVALLVAGEAKYGDHPEVLLIGVIIGGLLVFAIERAPRKVKQ